MAPPHENLGAFRGLLTTQSHPYGGHAQEPALPAHCYMSRLLWDLAGSALRVLKPEAGVGSVSQRPPLPVHTPLPKSGGEKDLAGPLAEAYRWLVAMRASLPT